MALNENIFITVAAVLGNHGDIIGDFIEDSLRVLSENYRYYELLIINNGSEDQVTATLETIQQQRSNIRSIRLSRRYDKQTALAAALDNSIGDYVVIMEINQDPPELIPVLIDKAVSGYDVVIAENTEKWASSMSKWISIVFYKIASRILDIPLNPRESYFRVISRQVVNSITKIKNKNQYLKYINLLVGFKRTYIPYTRICRNKDYMEDKNLFQSFILASDLIISNSAVPLRFASLLGLIASFLNLTYLIYIFIVTLVKDRLAEGWLTTSVMSTTMFLVLFIILTVLAEYVSRILEETKDRPLYFVEYETSSTKSVYKDEQLNIA